MEAGDGGVDSKDLQQQSKAFDKLTDRVEDRQLDSSRAQSVIFLSKFTFFICIIVSKNIIFKQTFLGKKGDFLMFFFAHGLVLTLQAMASIAASAEAEKNAMILRFDLFCFCSFLVRE